MSTTTSTTSEHDVLGMVIVNSQRWDSLEAMTELAQEFAWHGTEEVPPGQAGVVARFAQEVYKKSRDMRGKGISLKHSPASFTLGRRSAG
jgi:hypothetical protein